MLLPYVIAPFYRFVDPVSMPMLWRWMTGQRASSANGCRSSQISPALPLAVIVAEDGKFCTHHGIDFGELKQALMEADDLSDARGGSTITQQVAKNLFFWQSRSYVRKILEFPLALWIDLVLPKRRVLGNLFEYRSLGSEWRIRRAGRLHGAISTNRRPDLRPRGGCADDGDPAQPAPAMPESRDPACARSPEFTSAGWGRWPAGPIASGCDRLEFRRLFA